MIGVSNGLKFFFYGCSWSEFPSTTHHITTHSQTAHIEHDASERHKWYIYIYLFYAHILNRYRKSERKKTRALYCAAKLNALKAGCKDWKSQCRATVMTMCTLEQAIALKSPANKWDPIFSHEYSCCRRWALSQCSMCMAAPRFTSPPMAINGHSLMLLFCCSLHGAALSGDGGGKPKQLKTKKYDRNAKKGNDKTHHFRCAYTSLVWKSSGDKMKRILFGAKSESAEKRKKAERNEAASHWPHIKKRNVYIALNIKMRDINFIAVKLRRNDLRDW